MSIIGMDKDDQLEVIPPSKLLDELVKQQGELIETHKLLVKVLSCPPMVFKSKEAKET